MKIKEVIMKVRVEVKDDFDLNEISLCVTEWDEGNNIEIPFLKRDDFRVVDYIDIKEVTGFKDERKS